MRLVLSLGVCFCFLGFFSFSKQDDTSSLLLWRGLKDRQEVKVIESFEWSLQILEGGECRTVAHQICNLRTV